MIGKHWLIVAAAAAVAAGVVAFVALGVGSAGNPEQRLASWVSSTSLGQDIGTLYDDGVHVRQALAEHKDMNAVHTICEAMANDAQTYNDQLPSPDSAVTQLLARAYGLDYDAAEACSHADAPGASLFTQSAKDRTAADGLFKKVLADVRSKTGATVSTTTITVPGTTTTAIL